MWSFEDVKKTENISFFNNAQNSDISISDRGFCYLFFKGCVHISKLNLKVGEEIIFDISEKFHHSTQSTIKLEFNFD